jgi:hypothetical protein
MAPLPAVAQYSDIRPPYAYKDTNVGWTACQCEAIAYMAFKAAVALVNSEKIAPEDVVILGVNPSLLSSIRNRAGFPCRRNIVQARPR